MKIKYRPEIDGCRAIAVAAVIAYHAQIMILGFKPFQGGFIGVDIFFVISGYLITSIILKELITTGSFSFKYFYERRIRRLLPVLLLVMSVSIASAWIILMPISLIDFSKSIIYSLGFSSNFYFHYSGQIYGDGNGLLKPFLHTWSLSVEEQFYLLFPIILILSFKYYKNFLIYILIFGFFLSLWSADWGSRNHPSISFYFLHTRMWELLAGSILAYFEMSLGHRNKSKILNFTLPSVGWFLVGYSIFFFNDQMFHPSVYTLPPIIGVCLIIWFSHKDEFFTKILSSKLFVGIGLISYSLYLWHYPIFAFYRYIKNTTGDYSNVLKIFLLLLIVSILSYFFVEKPFREKKRIKFSLKIIFSLIFIIFTVNFFIITNDGASQRFQNIILQVEENNNEKPWNLLKNKKNQVCFDNENLCFFNTENEKRIFLIGDSNIATLSSDLKDKITNKEKYSLIVANRTACIFFPKFDTIYKKTKKKTPCNDEYFSNLKKLILKKDNNIIIFGGRLPFYISKKTFNNNEGGIEYNSFFKNRTFLRKGEFKTIEESFQKNVEYLEKKNKIILIYPIPENGWNVSRKLYLQQLFNKSNNSLSNKENWITTSSDLYINRTSYSHEILDNIKGKNIYRVYPHKLFCDTALKGRCISHDEKNIFYFDDHHPSKKGAEMINNLIMKVLENKS